MVDYKVNARKTLDKAQRTVKLHLEPFFGQLRASQVTTALVKEYIADRMDAGAAHATINRELSAIKRMYNPASQHTPPKVAQVSHIPMLKESNIRKGFFEHEDFLAVRAALPEHLKGLITFGYKTGWRISEITGLTWDCVDMKSGIIRLEPGEAKNSEGRTAYADDELKGVLRAQFSVRNLACPYVFHRKGQRIFRFDKAWKSACKAAGVPGKLFHDLRRTAVRNMVRAGVPETVAMKVSGHKTRAVFDRYDVTSGDDLKRAAAQLQEYINNQNGHKKGTIHKKGG